MKCSLLTYWIAFLPLVVFILAAWPRLLQHVHHTRGWTNYTENNVFNTSVCI